MNEDFTPLTHDLIDRVSFEVTQELMELTGLLPDPRLTNPDGTSTQVGMLVEAIQALIATLHDCVPDPTTSNSASE